MSIIHVIGSETGQRGIMRELPGDIRIITKYSALCGYRANHIFIHASAGLEPDDDWVNSVLKLRLAPGGQLVWLDRDGRPFSPLRMGCMHADANAVVGICYDCGDPRPKFAALAQELGYDIYVGAREGDVMRQLISMATELKQLRKEKAERNKRPALKLSDWGDRP